MKWSALVAGLIRLRSTPLPKLQGLEYVLNVTATDDNASGGPHPLSSTARVIVGVDDVNNNKPIFEEVRKQTLVLLGHLVYLIHTKKKEEKNVLNKINKNLDRRTLEKHKSLSQIQVQNKAHTRVDCMMDKGEELRGGRRTQSDNN